MHVGTWGPKSFAWTLRVTKPFVMFVLWLCSCGVALIGRGPRGVVVRGKRMLVISFSPLRRCVSAASYSPLMYSRSVKRRQQTSMTNVDVA